MNVRQIKTATLQQIFAEDVLPYNMVALADRFFELTKQDFQVIWNPAINEMTILSEKQVKNLPLQDEYQVIYYTRDPASVWIKGRCFTLDEATKRISEYPLWWDVIESAYLRQKAEQHES